MFFLTATADVRLLALGRDDFTRLLGPLQSLLESQAVSYDTPTSKISKVSELRDLHCAVGGCTVQPLPGSQAVSHDLPDQQGGDEASLRWR